MTAKYRHRLPQLTSNHPFLTEGGVETTLIYEKNVSLPHFATIVLLEDPERIQELRECYTTYIAAAVASGTGIVLETRTWRGALPWAEKLGIIPQHLITLNQRAVMLLQDIRSSAETESTPIVISGNIGPLSDAYKSSQDMTLELAYQHYHDQFKALVDNSVDLISAMTMTNMEEIKAAVKLAREFDVPIHVSFTIEHDGTLPNGYSLQEFMDEVDTATENYVTYFGINCAHPIHILRVLQTIPGNLRKRIGSIRGNASLKSHEELDASTELDRGDIDMFAKSFEEVRRCLPGLKVFGGCCGTDGEHLRATAQRLLNS